MLVVFLSLVDKVLCYLLLDVCRPQVANAIIRNKWVDAVPYVELRNDGGKA